MSKLIIGVVGPMAAGKGTIADYYIKNHKAVSYRFSTALFDICKILGIITDRFNLSRLSRVLREEFGPDTLAIALAEKVKNSNEDFIVVDGIRREGDIIELKKLDNFKIIYIDADINTRFERLKLRGEKEGDTTKTLDEFKSDHNLETEVSIPPLKEKSDFVIDNSGSLEELQHELEEILKAVSKGVN